MDDPDLVARLIALNERTRKAWAHPHNRKHYVPASFQGFREHGSASRQSTPSDEDMNKNVRREDTEPELRLYLYNRPKDITKGWVFGSDKDACDIYCGEFDKYNNYNIGRQTFSITLNTQRQVILKHLRDTNRTQVQYNSQDGGAREEFVWTMLPYCPKIYVISAKQLRFQVEVLQREAQTDSCLASRSRFLMDVWPPTPKIESPVQPFYYVRKDRPLGSGAFGKVYIVVDVSTGIEYAGKTFHGEVYPSEVMILANQNHKNILEYKRLSYNEGPLLVTDYLKEGNLARPWEEQGRPMWEIDEIVSILAQSLRALASLHGGQQPAIHRDIKPANILVKDLSSGPNSGESGPYIKLADFGLAIEGTRCIGESGTYAYTAPEVFSGPYSSKVDIWSLGVVILQLLMNGDVPTARKYMQGEDWCLDIMMGALANCNNSRKRDKFELRENEHSLRSLTWDFLRLFILEYDPKDRLSAQECLNNELFQHMLAGSRRKEKGWVRQEETCNDGGILSTRLTVWKRFKKSPIPKEPTDSLGAALLEELPDYARLTSPSATSSKNKASAVRGSHINGTSIAWALNLQSSVNSGNAPQPIGFEMKLESEDEKIVKANGKKVSKKTVKANGKKVSKKTVSANGKKVN